MELDGVSALGVSPNFGPGSGWHKTPPMAIPWSHADRIARRSAAYWCTVFLMRQQGVRLPAAVVLRERQPVSGGRWSLSNWDLAGQLTYTTTTFALSGYSSET